MRCPRSMGRLLRGGIFVLAVMLFGLPGLAQSVAFSGHVYEGTIPDRTVAVANVTVSLYGDDDQLPDNGPTTLLAQGVTDNSGAFLLQWTPLRLTYACLHVRMHKPQASDVTVAQAPAPGVVTDARTVTYLDVPQATYAGIEFWISSGASSAGLLPDLVVTALEIDPLSPAPGDNASLNASIGNLGAATASAFSVQFLVDGSPLAASLSIGGLSPGGSASVGTTAFDLSAGTHLVEAVVDADDEVLESDETNNTATASIVVGQADVEPRVELPDLMILSVDVAPRIASAAADRAFTCTVANVGTTRADATTLAVVDLRANLLASIAVPALGPGEQAELSASLRTAAAGEQQVLVRADSSDIVHEADETNNTATLALWTLSASRPDLVVSEVMVGPRIPGVPRRFTVRVENWGDADAGAFAVDLRAGSVPVSAPVFVDGLPFDAWLEVELFTSTGESILAAVADPDGWIAESDETNNTKAWVAEPALLTDLVMDDISVVSDPTTPDAVAASITVRNRGLTAASNVQLLFALVDPLQLDAEGESSDSPWLYRFSLTDLPDLSVGETFVWSDTWILNPRAPRLRLVALLDPFGLVAELDETNNVIQLEDWQGGE